MSFQTPQKPNRVGIIFESEDAVVEQDGIEV
jgi:hypothetical protein